YCAGCSGNAGRIRQRGRGEGDEVRRVEIGAIQQIEELGAELDVEAFVDARVFEHGEIPGGETGADESVAAQVAVEADGRRRRDKGLGIEPLTGFSENHAAIEIRIDEGPHGIAVVVVVRWVVAQLGRKRKTRLSGDDAGYRPAAHGGISESLEIV